MEKVYRMATILHDHHKCSNFFLESNGNIWIVALHFSLFSTKPDSAVLLLAILAFPFLWCCSSYSADTETLFFCGRKLASGRREVGKRWAEACDELC